jgi:DNA primase
MAISEGEIAQVRAATDIVALITEQVALKKSGRRWSGLCPFHTEKSPSFSVNAEEGRYYCFGCRAAGDQITWVREMMHLDFMEAVRLLADRAGITLHEDDSAAPARKEKAEFMAAMDQAVTWYHERLINGPDARPAREYLKSRGMNGDIARQFKLGWAPDEWDAVSTGLNLSPKVLEGTGLGFVNKRDRRQDALRARVIFPIFDTSGKAIAVGGRILPGANATPRPDGYVEPKYKNSPETAIYSKRRTLYALNWAKDNVIKTGEIIVCEGYTDVIACFMAEMPRAVATCGTALGEEHFRVMKNFAKRIVLAYDADNAGQSAAASVYQWEKSHDVDVAVARLPKGSDPHELAMSDPQALRDAIANAVPFLQFRLERVLDAAQIQTPEGRARAAEAALRVLAEHPSDIVRDQYLVMVADRLRLDVATLRPRVLDLVRGVTTTAAPLPTAAPRRSDPLPRPGLEALRLQLFFPDAVAGRLAGPLFANEIQRAIFEGLSSGASVSEVVDRLEASGESEAAATLAELSVTELDRTYTSDDVTAVVAQLLRAAVAVALKDVERELRNGSLDATVAMATIRDVKERVAMLGDPQAPTIEIELRDWLVSRAAEVS